MTVTSVNNHDLHHPAQNDLQIDQEELGCLKVHRYARLKITPHAQRSASPNLTAGSSITNPDSVATSWIFDTLAGRLPCGIHVSLATRESRSGG